MSNMSMKNLTNAPRMALFARGLNFLQPRLPIYPDASYHRYESG
jgi:hypothetical protein